MFKKEKVRRNAWITLQKELFFFLQKEYKPRLTHEKIVLCSCGALLWEEKKLEK